MVNIFHLFASRKEIAVKSHTVLWRIQYYDLSRTLTKLNVYFIDSVILSKQKQKYCKTSHWMSHNNCAKKYTNIDYDIERISIPLEYYSENTNNLYICDLVKRKYDHFNHEADSLI